MQWKLPSPTWPNIGIGIDARSMSAAVASMHSVRREIGTQTSVDTARAPWRSCRPAKYAWWRAAHSRLRSSVRVVHSKSSPPFVRAISCTSSACSLTLAAVPWNSRKSVGCSL